MSFPSIFPFWFLFHIKNIKVSYYLRHKVICFNLLSVVCCCFVFIFLLCTLCTYFSIIKFIILSDLSEYVSAAKIYPHFFFWTERISLSSWNISTYHSIKLPSTHNYWQNSLWEKSWVHWQLWTWLFCRQKKMPTLYLWTNMLWQCSEQLWIKINTFLQKYMQENIFYLF